MSIIFYLVYALVTPPAMFFAYNYHKIRPHEVKFRRQYISITIFVFTVLISTLQFIFPEIIPSLDRNADALLAGEYWRIITPLFIQPMGIGQCFFNALFFIAYIPLTEHFYGRMLILIYFGTGIVGQIVNIYWERSGGILAQSRGGSSPAIFGTLGALMMFMLMHRKELPRGYVLIPISVFLGAIILCFYMDGHAPPLLVGGLIGYVVKRGGLVSEAV